MRVVIQRVKYAKCHIDHKVVGEIKKGFMCLVGLSIEDTKVEVEKVAKKVAGLRIFDDEDGKMNLDLKSVDGKILSISQFTLYGDAKKGNRPSFINAKRPKEAIELYDYFNELLKKENIEVQTGVFGADMKIEMINDGPVTIILDSKEL